MNPLPPSLLRYTRTEHQTRFADRYDDPVEELPSLASDRQKARMNPDFFPTLTWQSFYNKKARVGACCAVRLSSI